MSTATITATKEQHNRFKDAPWYSKIEEPVLIGGAGGIGSWTAFLLARAGFKSIVYDFDQLEEHNLGGQLYPKRMIGSAKVDALSAIIKEYSDEDIIVLNEKITEESPTGTFVISAFDNMASRKIMFEKWFTLMRDNPELRSKGIFIDGRLNAEQMQIFCVTAETSKRCLEYREKHLFDDAAIADEPCSMKQTSHAAALIAGHITGFFSNHITNVAEEEQLRAVPFFWEYFIPMDLLERQEL